MMCLIRIVDGKPFEHPILVENYLQVYPDTDLENLPEGLAWFERKWRPELPPNTVFVDQHSTYEFDGTVWTDVWRIRDKTPEEIAEYTQKLNEQEVFVWNDDVQSRKRRFTEELAKCTSDADKAVLTAYLDALDKTVYRTIEDVENLRIPRFPRQLPDGSWVSVETSGSEPNVIG